MSIYLPIALIVISNVFYHVCAKATPNAINPLASLTITYLVGAIFSAVLYFIMSHGGNLLAEYKELNWSPIVLGLAVVGLEVGAIYMYKVGWDISVGQLIQSSILAVCLFIVGFIFYKEQITLPRVFGALICLVGVYFLSK